MSTNALGRALVGHAAMYGAARVAISGIDLLFTPLYARALSLSDFGLIAVAISLQAGVGIAYTLGLDGALFRLFYSAGSDAHRRREVIGGIAAGITGVAVVVACVLTALGPEAFGELLGGMSPRLYTLVIWGSVFNVYPMLLLQILQLRQQSMWYLAVAGGYALVRGVATVVLVLLLRRGTEGWAEAFAAATAASAIVALIVLRPQVSLRRAGATLREAVGYAIPQSIHQVSGWLAVAASRPILATLLPLSQVAIFYVAFGIGQGLGLLTTAISLAYGPAFMEAASRSEPEAADRFGRFASLYVSALILLAGVGALWRNLAVRVIAGPAYAAAAMLVPIVLGTFVLQGIYFTLVGPVFFRKESVRRLPFRTIGSAVAGLAGILLLVPHFGVAGAAWAALGANLVLVATVYPLSQRSVRMAYDHRMIATTAAVVGVAVCCSLVVELQMHAVAGAAMLTLLTAALALYGAAMLRSPAIVGNPG